jgi:hypothetical protein
MLIYKGTPMREQVLNILAQILANNLGNRLTNELANGIAFAFNENYDKLEKQDKPAES